MLIPARDHQPRRLAVSRFTLSFREVEDLLAQRGVTVTYETIRQWRLTFGLDYARRFKSAAHLERFATVHGVVPNLFRVGRHLLGSAHHRLLRTQAFGAWNAVTCGC